MKFRYYYTITKLAIIVLLPVVLLILPADFFDNGKTVCFSRLLFDVECHGCGLTRACMHLIHLEFEEAFAYNMGCFIALPVLGIFWIGWGIKEYRKFLKMRKDLQAATVVQH
ncbi:DUF2752 domain-containing protein [Pseudoflavitalea sp. G-6-1-2]|uniref:DUF2752 domain-containing protein n=1 Tax=Pseudoflavitalea sp. G-6-1-2 TaxID=2728841 RepID=UPI00146AF086|nr:DUF2752 domain-containing protein [Pseudoflavitalea sp. G-6-1-2]NML22078.1 DUF2752 domain-containing protein [Pseudoflavitalea sp. G-6-1-2]